MAGRKISAVEAAPHKKQTMLLPAETPIWADLTEQGEVISRYYNA